MKSKQSVLHQAGLEQFLNVLRVIKNKKTTNSRALTSYRRNNKRKFGLWEENYSANAAADSTSANYTGTKSQNRVEACMGPIALPCTFSLDNNAFALNFKTMRICKEKVVTGRNGADLKATETGEKEKNMLRKIKATVQGNIKRIKITCQACCNACISY